MSAGTNFRVDVRSVNLIRSAATFYVAMDFKQFHRNFSSMLPMLTIVWFDTHKLDGKHNVCVMLDKNGNFSFSSLRCKNFRWLFSFNKVVKLCWTNYMNWTPTKTQQINRKYAMIQQHSIVSMSKFWCYPSWIEQNSLHTEWKVSKYHRMFANSPPPPLLPPHASDSDIDSMCAFAHRKSSIVFHSIHSLFCMFIRMLCIHTIYRCFRFQYCMLCYILGFFLLFLHISNGVASRRGNFQCRHAWMCFVLLCIQFACGHMRTECFYMLAWRE